MAIPATPGGALGFQSILNKVLKEQPGNTERNMNNRKERLNEKFEEVRRDRSDRQKRRAMERFERTGKKRGKGIGTKRGGRRPVRGGFLGGKKGGGEVWSGGSRDFDERTGTYRPGFRLGDNDEGRKGVGSYGYDRRPVKGTTGKPVGAFGGLGGVLGVAGQAIKESRQNEIEKEFDKKPPKKGKGRPVKGGGKKGGGFLGGKKGGTMRDQVEKKWDKTPPKKGKGGGIKRGGKRRDVGRRIKKARRNRRGKK